MAKYKATKEQIAKAKEKLDNTKKLSETLIKDIINNYQTNIDDLIDFINFSSKMYNYSVRNVTLIKNQNPYALFVNSFKKWKDMGVNILRGSHGYTILVPKPVTVFKDDNNTLIKISEATRQQKEKIKSGEIKTEQIMHYGTGAVFDITQTDYPPENYPALFNVGYTSEDHDRLFKILSDYSVNNLDCEVSIKNVNGIALKGYYNISNNSIIISDKLNDTQKLSTLAHEIGHAIMHNNELNKNTINNPDKKEIEADLFSIYFQCFYDLEIPDSRKRHLVDSFNKYINTLEVKGIDQNEISDVLQKEIETVYNIFRKHAVMIDEINREKYQNIMIENEIEENNKTFEQLAL